jgi:phenylalanine-4-hydroxylase
MKETATRLTEYGLPIDPDAMVTPPDVTELELEPGHPGLGDEGYIQRRKSCSLCAARTGWRTSARR